MKRILSILAGLALAFSLTAAPVSAADNDNLAGKPWSGNFDESCPGTIYGRVDNRMVLFTAAHCGPIGTPGAAVYNSAGKRLGTVASNYNNMWDGDMGFIWLDSGMYPSTNRHVLSTGATLFANTYKYPPTSVNCSGLAGGAASNSQVRTGYWVNLGDPEGPFYGWMYGARNGIVNGNCEIITDIDNTWGARNIPSASPFVHDLSLFVGAATGKYSFGSYYGTTFNSWYSAIRRVHNYWDVRGTGVGAWFCSNSACT